ncbi:hypothetical protein OC842_004873 [Tilletia horrida]|uniref:TPR-like protein n=1 Tax=Tilletia horrida TaxID=155126 RepID=A0AAN6GBF6_9BASI|nr:hypothetical protein OC842_004873 [Tilletia horrida]
MSSSTPFNVAADTSGDDSEFDTEDEEFMDLIFSNLDDSEDDDDSDDDLDMYDMDMDSDSAFAQAYGTGSYGGQSKASAVAQRTAASIIKDFTMADCDASEDELEAGRPVARWDDSVKASAKVVEAFNDVAGVCPSASNSIRVGVELVRLIAETGATSLKTYSRDLDVICLLLLRFYHQVIAFNISRGYHRSEPATHTGPYLRYLHEPLVELCDHVSAHARLSVVKRSKDHDDLRIEIDNTRTSFKMAIDSFRILRKSPAMPYDIVHGTASAALSSRSQMMLCDAAIDDAKYAYEYAEDKEPDVKQLLGLHPFLRGSCWASSLSPVDDPTVEEEWRREGAKLATKYQNILDRASAADAKIMSAWPSRVVRFDATPARLEFQSVQQLRESNRHALTTLHVFYQTYASFGSWIFPSSSSDLQAIILAMYHLGSPKENIVFAELAALNLRDNFERCPSSTAQLRLVNALGVLACVQLKCKHKTDAYQSAEAAIRLLKSLDEEQLGKHAALEARLSFISAQALDRFHRPKLRAIMRRKLDEAVRLFEAALKTDEDDFDAKVGLAQALQMDRSDDPTKEVGLRMVDLYRELVSVRPILFEQELASSIAKLSKHLTVDDSATGPLVDEAIAIFKRQSSHATQETKHYTGEVYRKKAELQAAAGQVPAAIANLKTAIKYSKQGLYADLTVGDLYCAMSLLHVQLEKYEEADRVMDRARSHWRKHGHHDTSTQFKEEYVGALALFMANEHLLAADKLTASLRAMRKEMKDEFHIGVYDVKDDPDYALAMGDLGAVEAATGQNELALRHGSQALRLGLAHLKSESKDTSTRLYFSYKTCDDEIKVRVARLHLLYGATLLHVRRLAEAQEQVEKCIALVKSTPLGLARWGEPVLKTAYGCLERVLITQGKTFEGFEAGKPAADIARRGFLHCLAPFQP